MEAAAGRGASFPMRPTGETGSIGSPTSALLVSPGVVHPPQYSGVLAFAPSSLEQRASFGVDRRSHAIDFGRRRRPLPRGARPTFAAKFSFLPTTNFRRRPI